MGVTTWLGVRIAVAPSAAALALTFVAGGATLGVVSGLIPGLHANNMALLLAAGASAVPGPPRLVGAAMLAAGTMHTFLDVVPALSLGVPDPAMAASALPGHELVLAGRGREALRLSALGSGLAVALAVPLAIPVTEAVTALYPTIRANLSAVLAAVAVGLVTTEGSYRAKVGAGLALAASGALGLLTLDLPTNGLVSAGGTLAPLFAGLFGAPVLIDALGGGGVPPQDDATLALSKPAVGGLSVAGTLSGAVVGFLPGVSSAVAATGALLAVPYRFGARGFVVITSGVNTANTIFALLALRALGSPRTGVLVALESSGAPLAFPLLLASVALAAALGFVLVPTLGDRYLSLVGALDYRMLSVAVLALLLALSFVFAGPVGIGIFAVATVIGLVPPRFGSRRATLMGVLLVPLALG
ncbi:putative membrane protein [Halorientalis persicus]|jgi:putative membrane protein|uniref:Putative membrane protein n=1 Tax=Halorientalis persicus TaxID=1367881 RepID=A0A1H8TFD9_9EURY|nr:tripartite tricarboxylate transporter permease [Halorientalis persicus]SEO89466.1 putative membrane protein [Halorientalis persicus]